MNQLNKIFRDNLTIIIFSTIILFSVMMPEINLFGARVNLDYVIAFISLMIIFQALKPMIESMDKNYAVIWLGVVVVAIFVFILFFFNLLF